MATVGVKRLITGSCYSITIAWFHILNEAQQVCFIMHPHAKLQIVQQWHNDSVQPYVPLAVILQYMHSIKIAKCIMEIFFHQSEAWSTDHSSFLKTDLCYHVPMESSLTGVFNTDGIWKIFSKLLATFDKGVINNRKGVINNRGTFLLICQQQCSEVLQSNQCCCKQITNCLHQQSDTKCLTQVTKLTADQFINIVIVQMHN